MYFPIYVNLSDKHCLVVGDGTLAAGKAVQLLEAGATVTLLAEVLHSRLQEHPARGRVEWLQRPFRDADLDGVFLVFADTLDASLNRHIYDLANSQDKLVNVVDVPENANFIMPAIARSGPVQVAVSSSGASPILATRLRDKIRDYFLGDEVGRLAEYLGQWRTRVKLSLKSFEGRKLFWERVFQSEAPVMVKNGDMDGADLILEDLLVQTALHEDALKVGVPLELSTP